MRLSVLIPAFNERETIAAAVAAVCAALPSVDKEVVIVDDGSTDGMTAFLQETFSAATGRYRAVTVSGDGVKFDPALADEHAAISFKVLFHAKNRGKGAALQTAMKAATGDVVVIQDADLEYDPQDWVSMYNLIAERRVADVVYGSRFFGRPHRSLFYHHFLANRLISVVFNILYNQTLSDIEVCYKMFTRDVMNALHLTCDDFGVEVQMSAQIALNRKLRIYEVGISYFGRTYAEGKKIKWNDGLKALWYLVKFRFAGR